MATSGSSRQRHDRGAIRHIEGWIGINNPPPVIIFHKEGGDARLSRSLALKHFSSTPRRLSLVALLALNLCGITHLEAQATAFSLSRWQAELPAKQNHSSFADNLEYTVPEDSISKTHPHPLTGLLIGSAVGLAATGLFLAAFCGDPDTECGADEYGRALVIIAVPAAAAGALIGSLIHTSE